MLCRKFELIPIKIGFFTIFKVALKSGQKLRTIVQGNWERIFKFYLISVIYLCSISDVWEQWSDQLEPPTKESLAEAWKYALILHFVIWSPFLFIRWILHINPKGMCSLLESLHHVLESPAYDDGIT